MLSNNQLAQLLSGIADEEDINAFESGDFDGEYRHAQHAAIIREAARRLRDEA